MKHFMSFILSIFVIAVILTFHQYATAIIIDNKPGQEERIIIDNKPGQEEGIIIDNKPGQEEGIIIDNKPRRNN